VQKNRKRKKEEEDEKMIKIEIGKQRKRGGGWYEA
jgi:hypothetical protein